MKCIIHTNSLGKVIGVTTESGALSALFFKSATQPIYSTQDEAVEAVVLSQSMEDKISTKPEDRFATGEPKVFYFTPQGPTESFKDALNQSGGSTITFGFKDSKGEVLPIREVNTSLNNDTVQGVINNAILNGQLAPEKSRGSGDFYLQGEGQSQIERRTSANAVLVDLLSLDHPYTVDYQGLLVPNEDPITLPELEATPEVQNKLTGTGESTQEFFGNVVNGLDERFRPSRAYEYELPFSGEQLDFKEEYDAIKGHFDEHIATSIPTFRDLQVKKGAALVDIVPSLSSPLIYDLGGSEGSFIKTISKLSENKIQTINLDPSPEMKKAFDANKPESSTMVLEAFNQGWDDIPTHVPTQKAGVVHESMMFQFIDNGGERAEYLDEVKNNYLTPDGLFLTEEKFKMRTEEEYKENEKLKEPHKNKYYTKEQQSLKADQVLVGMKENQASYDQYLKELQSRFKYVVPYWTSGNFRGIAASDNKAIIDSFISELGYVSNPVYTAKPQVVTSNSNSKDIQLKRQSVVEEMNEIKSQAVANDTFMLAPNGQISNLSEQNWLLTRTQAFKDWFGNWEDNPAGSSKAVDVNGEPVAVHHGSNNSGYTQFSEGMTRDGGHFFSSDYSISSTYTENDEKLGHTPATTYEEALDKLASVRSGIYEQFNYKGLDFGDLEGIKNSLDEGEEFDIAEVEVELRDDANGDIITSGKGTEITEEMKEDVIQYANNYQASTPAITSYFLNLRDPLIINGNGRNWDDIYEVEVSDLNLYLNRNPEGDGYIFTDHLGDRHTFETLDELENYVNPIYGEFVSDHLPKSLENAGDFKFPGFGVPVGSYQYQGDPVTGEEALPPMATREWVQEAKSREHDGVIFIDIEDNGPVGYSGAGDVYVAFYSSDIKSEDNIGQFNPKDPDFRFSKSSTPTQVPIEIEQVLKPIIDRLKQNFGSGVHLHTTETLNNILESKNSLSRASNSFIKGFVDGRDVYLNTDEMTLDTPIHEFGHLWLNTSKLNNPELFKKGLNLVEQEGQAYIDYVRSTQPELQGEDLLEEALAQAIGDNGARLIEQKSNRLKDYLKEFFDWLSNAVGISDLFKSGEVENLTLEQFSTAVAIELLKTQNAPAADLIVSRNLGDGKTKITVDFLEEAKLPEYIKSGAIKIQPDLSFMDNTDVFFAGPDDTLVGTVSFDFGKGNIKEVKGDGGLYFPLSFEDIWAFKNTGNGTSLTVANKINELYNNNLAKGIDKTYVALVKGSEQKGISNPQGMEVAFRVLEGFVNSGIASNKAVKDSIIQAQEIANEEFKKLSLTTTNARRKKAGQELIKIEDYTPNYILNMDISSKQSIESLKDSVIDFFKNDKLVPFDMRKIYMSKVISGVWKNMDKAQRLKASKFLNTDNITKQDVFINKIIAVSSEGRVSKYNSGEVYAAIEITGPVTSKLDVDEGEREHPVFNGRIVQLDENGVKVPIKMHLIDGHFHYNDIATTVDGKSAYNEDGSKNLSNSGKIFGTSQSWGVGTIRTQHLKFSKGSPQEKFMNKVTNGNWGMMTAANPMAQKYDDVANYRANSRAKTWLTERGYKPTEIVGKYDNVENSFFVENLTQKDALAFMKEFGQDSVATDEALFYHDGTYSKRIPGMESFGGTYDNYYSTIEIEGEPMDFQVQYSNDRLLMEPMSYDNSPLYPYMTEDGDGNFIFNHWSEEQRDELVPGSKGNKFTGKDEGGAWSLVGGTIHFYTKMGDREDVVKGDYGHLVKVPKERVYDITTDRQNFYEKAKERFLEKRTGQAFTANNEVAFMAQIAKENGYQMVVSRWNNKARANSIIPLQPFDFSIPGPGNTLIKDFDNKFLSNMKKGFETKEINYPQNEQGLNQMMSDFDAKYSPEKMDSISGKGPIAAKYVAVSKSSIPNSDKVKFYLLAGSIYKQAINFVPQNIKDQVLKSLIDNGDIGYSCGN